jgi:hypothetical protein
MLLERTPAYTHDLYLSFARNNSLIMWVQSQREPCLDLLFSYRLCYHVYISAQTLIFMDNVKSTYQRCSDIKLGCLLLSLTSPLQVQYIAHKYQAKRS